MDSPLSTPLAAWRHAAHALLCGLALGLAVPAGPAHADYPERPIRLIVPAAAGGATDIVGRLLAQHLAPRLGQSVVVENLAGGGGTIGTRAVAQAAPDGHTLLVGAINHAINATLVDPLPYDSLKDFTFIAQAVSLPNVLVLHPSVPANDVGEFIEHLKARPGALSFAVSGIGTSQHLSGEIFKQMTGTEFQIVPYKGAGPAKTDLLGGHVHFMFDNLPSAVPLIREGRVRALGLTSAKRSEAVPDLPTLDEAGVTGFDVSSWMGLMGPAGLPPEIAERLHRELAAIAELPEVQERLAGLGAESVVTDPDEFSAYMRSEIERWGEVIRQGGIQTTSGQ